MGQFQAGGAFGGTAHQQALANSQGELAEQLGDISSTLRNADYDRQVNLREAAIDREFRDWQQDRAFDLQGIGMLPGLEEARYGGAEKLLGIGSMDQQLRQSALDTMYGDFQEWRDWDANRLGVLTNALGSVQGGTSTQTGANPNYRSAGQNAAAYAAILASLWGS